MTDGKEHDFQPRFRESAYTPVKKVVDTDVPDFEEMKKGVMRSSEAAIAKKKRVLERLRKKRGSSETDLGSTPFKKVMEEQKIQIHGLYYDLGTGR